MNCKAKCFLKNTSFGRKMIGAVSKGVAKTKHHSPELYLVGGIAAGIGAAVLFARAYKQHERVIEPIINDIRIERQIAKDTNVNGLPESTALAYRDLAVSTIKLYGPAATTAAVSIGLILASHGVMRGRQQIMLATLKTVEAGFNEYRDRVRKEYGEEAEERLWLGSEYGSVTRTEVDENGVETKKKNKQNHIGDKPSPLMYARVWDEENRDFTPDRGWNLFILRGKEVIFTDVLNARGHLMLNEVYRELNIPETPEGALVGWSLAAPGDNFVDFGLNKQTNNTDDARFILDFNVNGSVYEYIGG